MPSVMQQMLLSDGIATAKTSPSVVQRQSGAGSARATSFSPAWSAVAAGNLLVLELGVENNASAPSTPAGWTAAHTSVANGSGIRLSTFYMVAAGGETGVTISQGSNSWSWVMREISGANTTPIWGTAATGTSVSPDPPNVSPGSSGAYITVAGAAYATTTTSAYSPGYSNGVTASSTGNLVRTASAEKRSQIMTSEDPGAMTIGASAAWVSYTWTVGNV
jgi:hypothetical protein